MHSLMLLAVAGGSLFLAFPDGDEDPAVATARARQEAVKTVVVEFRLTETLAPGAISERSSLPTNPRRVFPAEETTLTSSNKLIFDGRKVRFEYNHFHWSLTSPTAGKFLPW